MQYKVRRVKTPEGRERFGQEIGEIIVPDAITGPMLADALRNYVIRKGLWNEERDGRLYQGHFFLSGIMKDYVCKNIAARMSDIPLEDMAKAIDPHNPIYDSIIDGKDPVKGYKPDEPLLLRWDEDEHYLTLVRYDPDNDYDDLYFLGEQEGWPQTGTEEAKQLARYALVSKLIKKWAQTSNDSDAVALAIQDTAKSLFRLRNAAPWELDTTHLDAGDIAYMERRREDGDKVFRRFLQAQYDLTQEMFKEMGIERITVYRGIKNKTDRAGRDLKSRRSVMRPLSACTTSPGVAYQFATEHHSHPAGAIYEIVVPVTKVLSTWVTGFGCTSEEEVVVLGGANTATAVDPATYPFTFYDPLGSNEPNGARVIPNVRVRLRRKSAQEPDTINFDDSDLNADWLRTMSWDLPRNPRYYIREHGDDLAKWFQHIMELPAGMAMPEDLRIALLEAIGTKGMESKANRYVRDPDYWNMPYGALIVADDEPSNPIDEILDLLKPAAVIQTPEPSRDHTPDEYLALAEMFARSSDWYVDFDTCQAIRLEGYKLCGEDPASPPPADARLRPDRHPRVHITERETRRKARILIKGIEAAPRYDGELYRSIWVPKGRMDAVKVGDPIDVPLLSAGDDVDALEDFFGNTDSLMNPDSAETVTFVFDRPQAVQGNTFDPALVVDPTKLHQLWDEGSPYVIDDEDRGVIGLNFEEMMFDFKDPKSLGIEQELSFTEYVVGGRFTVTKVEEIAGVRYIWVSQDDVFHIKRIAISQYDDLFNFPLNPTGDKFVKWYTPRGAVGAAESKTRHVRDADFWGAPVGTPLPLPPKPKIVVRKSPTAAVKVRTVSLTNLHHTYDAVGRGGKRRKLVEGQSRWGHGGVYLSRDSLSIRKHDTDVFPGPFTIFSVTDTTNGSAAIWRGQGTDRFFNRLLNQAAREAGYKSIRDVGAISDSDKNWEARQATYAKLRRIIEDYGFDGVEVGGEIVVWNYTKLKPAAPVSASKQTGEPMGVVATSEFTGAERAIYRRAMNVRKRIMDAIAKRTAKMSDEDKQRALDNVREVRQRGVVMVAAPKDAALKLLTEDRIKTQFETDTSPTVVAKQTRAVYETAVLDIHPGVDPAKRPVYGYMSVDKPTQRGVGRYGEIRFELKPTVHDRTSIAFGDSLGHSVIPIPLTSSDESGVFGAYSQYAPRYDLDTYQDRKFVEAQVRGGVHVSDIAAVYIPDTDDYNAVADKAAELGIAVNRYKYKPQPLVVRAIRTAEVRFRSSLARNIRKLGGESKEYKVRHVRDADFWGAPVGTPLPLPEKFRRPIRVRKRSDRHRPPTRFGPKWSPEMATLLERHPDRWEFRWRSPLGERFPTLIYHAPSGDYALTLDYERYWLQRITGEGSRGGWTDLEVSYQNIRTAITVATQDQMAYAPVDKPPRPLPARAIFDMGSRWTSNLEHLYRLDREGWRYQRWSRTDSHPIPTMVFGRGRRAARLWATNSGEYVVSFQGVDEHVEYFWDAVDYAEKVGGSPRVRVIRSADRPIRPGYERPDPIVVVPRKIKKGKKTGKPLAPIGKIKPKKGYVELRIDDNDTGEYLDRYGEVPEDQRNETETALIELRDSMKEVIEKAWKEAGIDKPIQTQTEVFWPSEGNPVVDLQFVIPYVTPTRDARIQRVITLGSTNEVSNEFFVLPPEYQGKGTAAKITRELEDLYREWGLERVTVHANIDVGGYAWARLGFDFESDYDRDAFLHMAQRRVDGEYGDTGLSDEQIQAAQDDIAKLTQRKARGHKVTAIEIAAIGYRPGDTMWIGKLCLLRSDWQGAKEL